MRVLFGVLVAVLSIFSAQNVSASSDEWTISYNVGTPTVGQAIPTTVEATLIKEGENQGTQTLNLFWYEVKNGSYKKVNYTNFKPGKTYRPSVVDVNFTWTSYTHSGHSIENPGSAYSNCSIIDKETNIETGSSHLSNAFRCDYSLAEIINDEVAKTFTLGNGEISKVNITLDTELAGKEVKKGESYECDKYNEETNSWQTSTCYEPATFPTPIFDNEEYYSLPSPTAARYVVGMPSEGVENYNESFFGTFEEGKNYYVSMYIVAGDGYNYKDNVEVFVNGSKTNNEIVFRGANVVIQVIVKIPVTKKQEKSATTVETEKKVETKKYEVLDGDNQKYDATSTKPLSFRFNVDYNEFKKTGKVFVDDKFVDAKDYTSKEGSTIITFNKAFTDKLSEGNHTVKVTVDSGEANGTFVITKSVKNPQTGDNIVTMFITLILSLIALISLRAYTKRNRI